MNKYITFILSLFLLGCSTTSKNRPQVFYKTTFSESNKTIVDAARKSAEKKISIVEGKKIKLIGRVSITIDKKKRPTEGTVIGGTSTYMPNAGSMIKIFYVDDLLFEKLEHEFAHAILNSNNLKIGHHKRYDKHFYNWGLSRKYGQ